VLAAPTISFVGLTFVGGGIWTLTLVLSEEAFGLGTEGSGFLNSAYGVGGILGGLAAGYLASKIRLGPAVIWSTAATSVVFLLLGVSPAGVLPFVILFIVGVLDTMVDVNGTTIIQTGTPEELLGRVFGAFESVLILAMLIRALLVGPLIELIGPRATTAVFAVVGLVIIAACLPRLSKLDKLPAASASGTASLDGCGRERGYACGWPRPFSEESKNTHALRDTRWHLFSDAVARKRGQAQGALKMK
jgi:MFS family permease